MSRMLELGRGKWKQPGKGNYKAIPSNNSGGIANNSHQCKAVYHSLTRKLQKVQTQIRLIQEPRFYKGQAREINSVNSQVVYHIGDLRQRAAIFMKGVQGNYSTWFYNTELVAVQIKCWEGEDQKDVMVCLTYHTSDSVDMPPPTEFRSW